MINKYKCIIYDWNGTILDDVNFGYSLLCELLRDNDIPEITIDKYKEMFTFPIKDYYVAAGFDFSKNTFKELADLYITRYLAGYRKNSILANGALELINKVKEANIKQIILSATKQKILDEQTNDFGIKEYFDNILGLDDHYANSKENLAIKFVNESGFKASEILFVGDTLHDLEVAESVGSDSVLLASGHQSYQKLTERIYSNIKKCKVNVLCDVIELIDYLGLGRRNVK